MGNFCTHSKDWVKCLITLVRGLINRAGLHFLMCIYTWLWRGFKTFQRIIPAKTWPAQYQQPLCVSVSPSICHFFKGWKTLKGTGAVWAVGPNPHISVICSVSNTSLALNGRIRVYIQSQLARFSLLVCPADSSFHIPGDLLHSQRSMTNQAPAQDLFFCRENLSWWALGVSTQSEEQRCGSTPCWLRPSPSSMSLSQCAVCRVSQAFPLFQRGKYWTRWGDSARMAWFSLGFLCISHLLFWYVIKSLQEARPV